MPRGKKELAEQITPELREVEVEAGRCKTVREESTRLGMIQRSPCRNSHMVTVGSSAPAASTAAGASGFRSHCLDDATARARPSSGAASAEP